ncbi:hypothetical protein M8C21_012902, partial [Ambrosia artemisiifolia]
MRFVVYLQFLLFFVVPNAWMRAMIGVVEARDLPAQPSEEEFRVSLKSGLILCHVINKVDPGSVPKKGIKQDNNGLDRRSELNAKGIDI